MKSLSSYTDVHLTQLFRNLGAFFAFGQHQFEERRKEGVDYIAVAGGLVVPKENADALLKGLNDISAKGMAQDLAENGREGIIRRELMNYECYYVGSVTACVEALEPYGITRDEIVAVYRKELSSGNIEL